LKRRSGEKQNRSKQTNYTQTDSNNQQEENNEQRPQQYKRKETEEAEANSSLIQDDFN